MTICLRYVILVVGAEVDDHVFRVGGFDWRLGCREIVRKKGPPVSEKAFFDPPSVFSHCLSSSNRGYSAQTVFCGN